MSSKAIYFPGLNGLRAIAAIAVVVSHITLGLGEFKLEPNFFGTFQNGQPKGLAMAGFGVTIFFVLSGFLITYLLVAEKKIQPISIKKFYLRRLLRIWPLYYLYLTFALLVILIFGLDLDIKSLFLYLFYAANVPFILHSTIPFIGHYWSLGVEEQFYLFWPWFNQKIKRLIPAILLFIALLLGSKIFLHFLTPGSLLENIIQVTRFHCMMIGALGAILYDKENKTFIGLINNKITQTICWFAILLVAINKFHFASFIDHEIISVVTLCIIVGQINVTHRLINLDIKIFDFLGKISYGIYVIHPLVIFLFAKFINQFSIYQPYKYAVVYFSVVSITILLAYTSYTYFEKYFMTLKKKFEVVKSSASKESDSYQENSGYRSKLSMATA